MSLFQCKEWWSIKINNEEFDKGCLIIKNIENNEKTTSILK